MRPFDGAWPFLHLHRDAGLALVCVAAGVVMFPWTLTDVRRRALPLSAAAGVIVLCLTGVGALLWRVVRDRRPELRAAGKARLTPVSVLVVLVLGTALGVGLLGDRRVLHLWEVRASDPRAEIFVGGEAVGRGVARGLRIGRPLDSGSGFATDVSAAGGALPAGKAWSLREPCGDAGGMFGADEELTTSRGYSPRTFTVRRKHAMFRTVLEIELRD